MARHHHFSCYAGAILVFGGARKVAITDRGRVTQPALEGYPLLETGTGRGNA